MFWFWILDLERANVEERILKTKRRLGKEIMRQ
jgi:hypothetical protein